MAGMAATALIDGLFRREAGRMTARLARLLGPGQLDEAEEIVQTALLRAMQVWPHAGIPENPAGWLWRTARNAAIDRLRLRRFTAPVTAADLVAELAVPAADDVHYAGEVQEETLALMFACCHPLLSPEARVALTLKCVAGLGVREIARAFLLNEATVGQRLTRAKAKLAEAAVPFAIPAGADLPARLEAVLTTLYLMFNEAYGASEGETLIRPALAADAVRLVRALADHPVTGTPASQAMAALICLTAARLPGRCDADGLPLPLAEQDRRSWDQRLIGLGFQHLRASLAGTEETRWHLEAAIAATHAAAPDWGSTDWDRITHLYDRLLALHPSPVAMLNRAVALAERDGAAAGLSALAAIAADPTLTRYPLYQATRAEFFRRLGDTSQAASCLRTCLAPGSPLSGPERRRLQQRLDALAQEGKCNING